MNMVVDIAIHVVYNKINKNLRILNNGLWVTKKDKIYWLRKITTINLKKIGGGSAAQDKIIHDYAKKDRVFIKRQIELYKPDIIICCGRGKGKNADILHAIFYKDKNINII